NSSCDDASSDDTAGDDSAARAAKIGLLSRARRRTATRLPSSKSVGRPFMVIRRLTRSRTDGKVAGVCAGLASYFDVDVVLVRAAWVVFSIVPGAFIGGVLAYLGAWLLIPEATEPATVSQGRRLTRSATDKRLA